ncbi:unnamed protein product, partial [Closterium sp. NIES-53]
CTATAVCKPPLQPCTQSLLACLLPCRLRTRLAYTARMATLNVLAFDPDGRPVEFSTWLDDLQLFLMTDAKDGVSLFDYVSGTAVAPAATEPALDRSLWQTRDAAARLAICNHLLIIERAHFSQHKTAKALYDHLPRSIPPLPTGPAPTCVPCVEGRQRAAPHSSEFPPTEAPLQTLHMDVWGPARRRRVFLRPSASFCRAEGIRQTFMLAASPQQNGIAERRIGMVMDVARTSMIHAAAPHFLWPFAIQYAAHQLNLQPRVSVPETSQTLRWTRKVGDASAFRVWGSRAFVHDLSADKLSSRAVPCVFLGFPPDAPVGSVLPSLPLPHCTPPPPHRSSSRPFPPR